MARKVYLITGAARGIGLSLVKELAANHTDVSVFAGVRDLGTAETVRELSVKYPGKIIIVKYLAGDEANNRDVAREIEAKHGHLDTVIACAVIASLTGPAVETSLSEMRDHFEVNTFGVLALFQAVYPLLKASSSPRFVPMTSPAASLTTFVSLPLDFMCYGASKAALNYIARKIHFENAWLVCFPLAPGIVKTETSQKNREKDKTGVLAEFQDSRAIPADDAARLLIVLVEHATREKEGGEFVNIDGTKLAW